MYSILIPALTLVVGLGLGALAYVMWLRRSSSTAAALRMPHRWPLQARPMLTAEESQAFDWLRGIFPDHFVMCKLPVLRFTVPVKKERLRMSRRWQELLHGVYCTFTVCTKDGTVVGCVDVVGRRGLTGVSRDLKERLLEDCRVAYTTVRTSELPNAGSMRAAFLGEVAGHKSASEAPVTRGGDSSFNADLEYFSDEKRLEAKQAALKELNKKSNLQAVGSSGAGFDPDGTGKFAPRRAGRSKTPYDDSFIAPIESRPSNLSR